MLPMPETTVWSSSARLSPVRRRRSRGHRPVQVERRVHGVPGDVRDRLREQAAARPAPADAATCRRTCAGRRNALRPDVGEGKPDAQVRSRQTVPGRRPATDRSSPDERATLVPWPRRPGQATGTCRGDEAGHHRPASRAAKSSAPDWCRRTARGCKTSTRSMRRLSTCSARPRRTVSTSGSSGTAGSIRRDAAPAGDSGAPGRSAACCSASFLVPAPRRAESRPRDHPWR